MPLDDQIRALVEDQATTLDRCAEIVQEVQSRIPRPSPAEIEKVRKGDRPMTHDEYLLSRLQRVVVTLENVVSDLRMDLEYGFEPGAEVDVNALAAAAEQNPELLVKTSDFSHFQTSGPQDRKNS
ncbi:MAG: hypothetical protein ABUT39_21415 [Acidobacteriota bacterium]